MQVCPFVSSPIAFLKKMMQSKSRLLPTLFWNSIYVTFFYIIIIIIIPITLPFFLLFRWIDQDSIEVYPVLCMQFIRVCVVWETGNDVLKSTHGVTTKGSESKETNLGLIQERKKIVDGYVCIPSRISTVAWYGGRHVIGSLRSDPPPPPPPKPPCTFDQPHQRWDHTHRWSNDISTVILIESRPFFFSLLYRI